YVIRHGTTDVVTYLEEFWGDQLHSGSFDDFWFFKANRLIEDWSFMPLEEKNALSSMVSRSEARIDAIQTLLHSAVKKADLAEIQQAAKNQPWSMDQFDHRGETPLHLAARSGNLDAVRELLNLGCNIDQRDSAGDTVLTIACAEGYAPMAQYLVDAGCNVGVKNNLGFTALHRAAEATGESSMEIIRSLLSAGASATATTKDGRSALHYLVTSDSDKAIFGANLRILLDAGADLEARNYMGKRPLDEAIMENSQVSLQCLIEAGARTTSSGCSENILHLAAFFTDHSMLSYLESLSISGLNTHMVDQYGNTAWDYFIYVSYSEYWRISGYRRPTEEEAQAFVRLYQGVRDRNLDLDMKILQRVRQYLLHKDTRGAATALDSLVKQKEEWERWDLVETYKTIGLQTREAMWDAAIESVDENLEVLQEEMAKSPWKNSSHWDWLLYEDSDETASESEDESKTATVHSNEEEEHLLAFEEEEADG
ncbi:ankryin domain-containing protein, partial [Colletotrichum incanum]